MITRKPRGRSSTKALAEITRLKDLWCDPLANIDRLYWRRRFLSVTTQAEIREEILKTFGINLSRDSRLTDFRDWVHAMDASATDDYCI